MSHNAFRRALLTTALTAVSLPFGVSGAMAQAASPQPAAAASPPAPSAPALQEVIVTAAKRTSTIQQTAGSITAIGGDQILARGFTSFSDLSATIPGLSYTTSGPGQTEFELRGVSSPGGNSPTVGFYLDDIPLTAAANSDSGKVVIDPSLYDIDRVEVLRGPQGTLYGSGSMGGTIKIVTHQPNLSAYDASGDVKLSGTDGGGFNHTESVMVNLPIVEDKAALRLVGTQESDSGWIDRIVPANGTFPNPTGAVRGDVAAAPVAEDYKGVNHVDTTTLRAALLVQPIENLSITPSVFYQQIRQGGPSSFDTDPGTYAHYQPYDIAEPYSENFLLENLNVQYKTPIASITSNTAYFSRNQTQTQDASEILTSALDSPSQYEYGPAPVDYEDRTKQFSEELRAVSSGNGRFKWLVGAFYSDLQSTGMNHAFVDGLEPFFGTTDLFTRVQPYTIKQGALFGETSYQILPSLKATVGLRGYDYSTSVITTSSGLVGPTGTSASTTTVAKAQAKGVNPKFDVTYTPTSDLTLYATVAKGFRPGGGNQEIVTGSSVEGQACSADLAKLGLNNAPLQYGPDSLWSYEIGEKARFFERRLSINASAYEIDWSGIQQGVSLGCGFAFTANAGSAKIQGGEVEMRALLTSELELNDSLGYIDARISEGSIAAGTVTGDPLQTVPRWTNNIGLTYHHPLDNGLSLLAHIENNFVGKRYDQAYLSLTPTPSYDMTNIRVGVTSGRWTVTAFADNVFNTKAILSYATSASEYIPQYNRAVPATPLTAGVEFSVKY